MSKTYCAYELARLTVGYDPKERKTAVRQWSLAVTGPVELIGDDLSAAAREEVERVLRSAAEEALREAIAAAYAVPGELAAKLAAAWQVFSQRFPVLVQLKANEAAQAFIDAFAVGLYEVVLFEDGLVLDATAGKATAQVYRELYDKVRGAVGGDVGKVVGQYFDLMNRYNDLQSIELKIRAPREVEDALAEAARGAQALADMPQRLVDLTQALDDEAKRLAAEVAALPDKASQEAQRLVAEVQRLGTEKVAAVVAQMGQFSQNLVKQLAQAGVRLEIDPNIVAALPVGMPRLDLNAAGDLGGRLSSEAQKILQNLGAEAAKEVRKLLGGLDEVKQAIEVAIKAGAEQTVAQLKLEFERRAADFEDARKKLGAVEQKLRDGNFTAAAQSMAAEAAAVVLQADALSVVVQGAPAAVANVARDIAQKAYEAAAAAVERAAQDIGNTVRRAFGF